MFKKTAKKTFEFLVPKPKVPKSRLEKAESKYIIAKHKADMAQKKLDLTNFEIENPKFSKGDYTYDPSKRNVEKASKKRKELKEKKQETKPKHFYAPKNFNKGGRVGLKRGTFPDHSGDGKITKKDILMAKGVIPKPKSKKKII